MRTRHRRVVMTNVLIVAILGATTTSSERTQRSLDERDRALRAADAFLDDYLLPDGRVVRVDQGGDTVSEGQAYAMLLAAAIGDEQRFDSAWDWTRVHLQREDGLLSWRWADGRVADTEAATDADLIAAWALARAGRAFDDPGLTASAAEMGDAVLARETVPARGGRLLVAGPWARESKVVNPSYLVTIAMSQLWWLTGETRWAAVAATSRAVLRSATGIDSRPRLPADWVGVAGEPMRSPRGDAPRFGFDAARTIVQAAVDCSGTGHAVAASGWRFFEDIAPDDMRAVYSLDGEPSTTDRHPVVLVAAAAAAHAAGDLDASRELLAGADRLHTEEPTYYGAAWIAIGRVLLDTTLVGGCASSAR